MGRTVGTGADSCHTRKTFARRTAGILALQPLPTCGSGLGSLYRLLLYRPVSPMRELERAAADFSPVLPRRLVVVGRGRLGSAIAPALCAAGIDVAGPLGRDDAPPASADAVLLCVPDAAIADAAADYAGIAPLVGHTSGATPLAALDAFGAEAFGLHPLQTFAERGAAFEGVGC